MTTPPAMPNHASPARRVHGVVQRQIPVGTHVQVHDSGGNWFGQIVATQPGQRYVVRVGGTDRTTSVSHERVSLHPTTLAMLAAAAEKERPLTPRAWNIIRNSPDMAKSVEGIKIKREGLRKVIGQAAYMTGDQTGILAAMSLDPDLCVDILVDDVYYLQAYVQEAGNFKLPLVQFYLLKHPKDVSQISSVDPEGWVTAKLKNRMRAQAKEICDNYTAAGISIDRIKLVPVPDARKAYKAYEQAFVHDPRVPVRPAWFATQTVSDAFRANAKRSRAHLAGAMFFNIDPKIAADIEQFCTTNFLRNEKLLLLWGRRSGQNPGGAHPELDTNKYAVTQILNVLRQRDPFRKIVVIGDPIFKRLADSKKARNRSFIDLVEFWNKVAPGRKLDRLSQLFFLDCLNKWCDVIALGMRSGVLEGPALLGMRTLFIEDLACHPEFGGNVGDRMEMWSGGIGQTPALANYRRVQTVARLGVITEMLSTLQLIRAFWNSRPPVKDAKLTQADFSICQAMDSLAKYASEATLILSPARKRVRFIDSQTLTTMANPAMMSEIGKGEKEPSGKGAKVQKTMEADEDAPESSVVLPVLAERITTCARTLRSVLVQYYRQNASNLATDKRDLIYYVLKDALKILVRLSEQDLKLVLMNFRRLERLPRL